MFIAIIFAIALLFTKPSCQLPQHICMAFRRYVCYNKKEFQILPKVDNNPDTIKDAVKCK